MASFDPAIEYVLENEGGFSVDHAGPTMYGIILPLLKEFGIDVDGDGDVDVADIMAIGIPEAKRIWRQTRWEPYHLADLLSQRVATKILDIFVNFGPGQGATIVQRALGAADQKVIIDGKFGPKTRAAVNTADATMLLAALRSEAAGFYRLILKTHPDFGIYETGWLRRAYQ